MNISIVYREMKHGEEDKVFVLVARVFSEFVAPGYPQAGIDEFMKYIQPDELASHIGRNHFVLIAEFSSEIIGVIEVRNHNHIALLFVDARFQRRGIGRELIRKALEMCRRNEAGLSQLTVNASPNSIKAYERMGFQTTDQEKSVNGIRFVAMALHLSHEDGGSNSSFYSTLE